MGKHQEHRACKQRAQLWRDARKHTTLGLHEPPASLLEDREIGDGISHELSVGAPSIPFPVAWEVMKGPPSKLICSSLIAHRSSVTEEPQVIGRR